MNSKEYRDYGRIANRIVVRDRACNYSLINVKRHPLAGSSVLIGGSNHHSVKRVASLVESLC